MTELVYDPREDVLVVTLSTENITMVSSDGRVTRQLSIKAREIALSDEGYFAFHFLDGEHKGKYTDTVSHLLTANGLVLTI